ncbi:FAD/NAD(P)-binding protein [Brevibacterium sp. BRM-1]|uniref:FAD/NAD(P)-binding protein n=1 Tax=Brevibacterium sp. BRM-1 TaxID=2999062 RepID=UPI0022804570|nr:FAD/NAD(P)-binding protein [Brevibacterium sp. BRM-1]WAL41360.1 FAD/NAD(P)-binding protein [Brevibacterium sp. BRM-1]
MSAALAQAPARLVFVGGGPKTTGLLLALAALGRADRGALPTRLRIDVVEPCEPGAGRIWRRDQDPNLWMNSLAEDVTIFADDTLEPAPVPGPSLHEWAGGTLSAGEFAPRRRQGDYLTAAFDAAVAALPDGLSVRVHRGTAAQVRRAPGGRQEVTVESAHPGQEGGQGRPLRLSADALVLAQGFVEVEPDAATTALQRAARARGLTYVAPGYTADVDLRVLPAGADVLVRGMGLAFIDALMMLTAGRGGTFSRGADGRLSYAPSGREPILWAGSRRGMPYRPKLGYRPEGMRLAPPRYIGAQLLEALRGEDGFVSVEGSALPLLEAEMAAAHYIELAGRHPERVSASADDFTALIDRQVAALVAGDAAARRAAQEALDALVERAVAQPADRFDLGALDRPLDGVRTDSAAALGEAIAGHIEAELARAADPHYSQDSAVFHALVSGYFALREHVSSGIFTPEDRIRSFDGRLHGLFSFLASGPPPERLEALLALVRAGIVRFVGPDMSVEVGDGAFVARSSGHGEALRAPALLEARLAPVSAARAADPLLRGLLAEGSLLLEAGAGHAAKFVTAPSGRAIGGDGRPVPDLFLVGPSVAGSVGEAFARPGTNSRVFRDNARLAREIAGQLAQPGARTGDAVGAGTGDAGAEAAGDEAAGGDAEQAGTEPHGTEPRDTEHACAEPRGAETGRAASAAARPAGRARRRVRALSRSAPRPR